MAPAHSALLQEDDLAQQEEGGHDQSVDQLDRNSLAIEHVSDKLCDEDDGFTKAIQMLDACFQYDERVEMPRALERFFYQLQRRPDQTLLPYTSEHREQLREIEKHNIKLPASVVDAEEVRTDPRTASDGSIPVWHCLGRHEG